MCLKWDPLKKIYLEKIYILGHRALEKDSAFKKYFKKIRFSLKSTFKRTFLKGTFSKRSCFKRYYLIFFKFTFLKSYYFKNKLLKYFLAY